MIDDLMVEEFPSGVKITLYPSDDVEATAVVLTGEQACELADRLNETRAAIAHLDTII